MSEWTELKEYVEALLKDGKRSQHEDFQVLFRIFGEEKIRKMVDGILAELKLRKAELESERGQGA